MATLLSLADARSAIGGTPSGDLADDVLVQVYIDAVTRVIEDLSQPVGTMARTWSCNGGGQAVALPWPFASVTSIFESGAILASTDYDADGTAGLIYRGTYGSPSVWTAGRRNVVVTVSVGVTVVPGNQVLAARMLFAHLWRTRNGPRPAFNAPGGDVVYTPSGFAVPNAVAELLVATPPLPGFA